MTIDADAIQTTISDRHSGVVVLSQRREAEMDTTAAVARLEEALRRNKHCNGQLIASGRAFALNVGPSEGPEALAIIHCDDLFADTFWYGHVMRHPHREGVFVALLTRSSRFLNARSVPLLFRRHHHWMMSDPHYQPAAVQSNEEAYAERTSYEQAVIALVQIINAFDPELRSGYDGSASEGSRCEMRILSIYGITGKVEIDGSRPPIPEVNPLSIVT